MDYIAHQAPLSMWFPRQEYWTELPFPSPRVLPYPGFESIFCALAGGFLTTEPRGKSYNRICCSVAKSYMTLCNPMDSSISVPSVLHYLLGLAQTHVHWVYDAIQPCYPLSPPSPSAFNLSQHQGLFQWIDSLHQVAKVLELLWIIRVYFLLDWLICSQGTLKSLLKHHNSKALILQDSVFFMVQLSHLVHDYWENHISSRIALSYVLAEQGANCAVANTTCCTKINISGDTETHLRSLTKLGTWLKKVTLSQSLSLTYFILIGLGLRDHGSEVHSKHWEFSCL